MIKEFKNYAKELLNIALPIIMGNLGFILIGAGDVFIAGRHSTDTLASISIATAIINVIFMIGVGLLGSISPILSNKRGEKTQAKRYFFPTIRFSLIISAITSIITLAFVPLIDVLNFEQHLVSDIKIYMIISAFSTFGMYLYNALKEYLQAFEVVFLPNLVTVICVFLNLILNAIFVFGLGKIPSLGVIGLAIASFLVRYIMGFSLLIYCLLKLRLKNYVDKNYYKTILKIGLPISLAVMVEFIAFNSAAIIMGRISGIYAAAQNLICIMTTISFMIPLAISNAIAVKVGFANGARNLYDLKKYSQIGILMSVGFMAFSAIIFASCPHFLVSLFTNDTNLIEICVPIIYIVAMFQICDGLQVSLGGVFKGIKETKIVLILNSISYWIVYFPLGFYFAFKLGLNLQGFWYGLFASSVILSTTLLIILIKRLKNHTFNNA
ncbi:MAG: MATE family efflux transporter [Candidatus Gastranaerophilales bacterium]